MKSTLRALTIGTTLLLSGCQYYTLAAAGQPIEVANRLTVTSPIDWSRHTAGNSETWTVDGPALQELTFFADVEDGKPLAPDSFWLNLQRTTKKEGNPPTFRSSMDALEVADLVRETFDRNGLEKFAFTNVRPQTFGTVGGFRFDFSFVTQKGLQKRGLARGAVVDGMLNIAIYTGTKEYYFERYTGEVEQILSTLNIKQG